MKKKRQYFRTFIPLSLFSCVVIAGTRPSYQNHVFQQTITKASLDSIREKNNLTLRLIESKTKFYELKTKDK